MPFGQSVPASCITECNVNFFRLLLLLVNGGKDVLIKLFHTRLSPNTTVDSYLKIYKHILVNLRSKTKIIRSTQWRLLFPVAKPDEWDISLWCLLLGNICGIPPPVDWNKPPPAGDVSLEADLVRLRLFRNDICHVANVQADDVSFQTLWNNISAVLLRLSNHDPHYTKTLEKTFETYKEGPLPTSSDQKVLLLELKEWHTKDCMEEANDIKSMLSDLMEMVSQLEPKLVQPLHATVAQMNSHMERYSGKWSSKITKIISDLDRKIDNYKKQSRHGDAVGARHADVSRELDTFSQRIRSFKKNFVDNMNILVQLMERQNQSSATLLNNQEIIRMNQVKMMQQRDADQTETRLMLQNIMNHLPSVCTTCTKGKKYDKPERRDEERKTCQKGNDVMMDCGHRYDACDLDDYLRLLLDLGHTDLICYKKLCKTEWSISELRHKLKWTDQTNQYYEKTLNHNYFQTADIKACPSCRSYCTRMNDRDIRVRCLSCRRFEFCWGCEQKWESSRKHVYCEGAIHVIGKYKTLFTTSSCLETSKDQRKTMRYLL